MAKTYNRKHGHASDRASGRGHSLTYRSWAMMIQRCTNPVFPSWKTYGAKGISVCPRWLTFSNFLADMGERPKGTSIDRFPNRRGNYEPGNCRWATPLQQRLNSRQLHLLTFRGESLPLKYWARRIGVSRTTLSNRIHYLGWSVEKALTTSAEEGTEQRRAVFATYPRDREGHCKRICR